MRGKTLLDLESYKMNGCKPIRPSAIQEGRGKKTIWLVKCYCGELFNMSQEAMGKSRSPKRRKLHYSCGCKPQQ